jgi:sugar lactone lactonase YvrE
LSDSLGNAQPVTAAGWSVAYCQKPSPLIGANGIRIGPDGRLYVAQAFGSQVHAVDVATGKIDTVVPIDGDILHPDDLAFDSHGTLYATEINTGRVNARLTDGTTRVIGDGFVFPNGVTIHDDRIFMDEFREGGGLYELYLDGRPRRLICDNLPSPNALCLGPDGFIYFPAVSVNEVWRVPVGGGEAQIFAGDLAMPIAVKVDEHGSVYVPSAATGDIWRIDIKTGARSRAGTTRPGIDNIALGRDGELYVSQCVDGGITVFSEGGVQRTLVDSAMLGPWGLGAARDGSVWVADGLSQARVERDGSVRRVSNIGHHFPGFLRGIAESADGALLATNSANEVVRYRPCEELQVLASGIGQAMDLAEMPNGDVVVCDAGNGTLVTVNGKDRATTARGLGQPTGLAIGSGGSLYVTDARGGRLLHVRGRDVAVLATGFIEPHGVACAGENVFVVDRGAKTLVAVDRHGGTTAIARNLPVGVPPGVVPNILNGIPGSLAGPIVPFADVAVSGGGTLYIGGDGNRSILKIRRTDDTRN